MWIFSAFTAVTKCLSFTASQGQVLEFHILQVHLHFWCAECSDSGRSGDVVPLVLRACVSSSDGSALQGSLWICEFGPRAVFWDMEILFLVQALAPQKSQRDHSDQFLPLCISQLQMLALKCSVNLPPSAFPWDKWSWRYLFPLMNCSFCVPCNYCYITLGCPHRSPQWRKLDSRTSFRLVPFKIGPWSLFLWILCSASSSFSSNKVDCQYLYDIQHNFLSYFPVSANTRNKFSRDAETEGLARKKELEFEQ